MNPLAIAGLVVAGQYAIESLGGWPALVGQLKLYAGAGASGTPLPTTNSAGNQAAVAYLAGLGSIAGIPVVVDPQAPSVTSIWTSMASSVSSSTDGAALATAFLAAYDAARAADPINYALVTVGSDVGSLSALGIMAGTCTTLDSSTLNSLGTAACALSNDRDAYGSGSAWLTAFGVDSGSANNTQIITDIATLASEMDAVGYTQAGLSPLEQDQPFTLAAVEGGIAYATGQVFKTVAGGAASLVGSALGDVGAAVLGSPYFWAAGLALVAWHVGGRPAFWRVI